MSIILITDSGLSVIHIACELPNYQSKNGQIIAVSKNGTEVPIGIKGINWFGMETYVINNQHKVWDSTDSDSLQRRLHSSRPLGQR